jgi:hypothetical protein
MSITVFKRTGIMNKIFKFKALFTLGVFYFLQVFYSSSVMAQNANELKHMKRQNDSTLSFDGKSYFKALRKAGLSSSEASAAVRNLKSETDTINAVEKLKNKISKNTESSGFSANQLSHLQQTVGEWKIRMVIRFGPGKKVPRPPPVHVTFLMARHLNARIPILVLKMVHLMDGWVEQGSTLLFMIIAVWGSILMQWEL